MAVPEGALVVHKSKKASKMRLAGGETRKKFKKR
jgi:hypothetical protein